MFKFLFLIAFSFTIDTSFAKDQELDLIKKMTEEYVLAIANGDQKSYNERISERYLKEQTKVGFVKRIFSKKKSKRKDKISFDFKAIKAAKTPHKYFINIKDKNVKDFDDEWFIVVKDKKSNWVIDGIHHMED